MKCLRYSFVLLVTTVFVGCGGNNDPRRTPPPYSPPYVGGFGSQGCSPPVNVTGGIHSYCQWLMTQGPLSQCNEQARRLELQTFCQQYYNRGNYSRFVSVGIPRSNICVRGWGPFAVWWHGMACGSGKSKQKLREGNNRKFEKVKERRSERESERIRRRKDRRGESVAQGEVSRSGEIVLDMNRCRKIMPSRNPINDKMDKFFEDKEDALNHARNYNVECFERGVGWVPLRQKPESMAKAAPIQQEVSENKTEGGPDSIQGVTTVLKAPPQNENTKSQSNTGELAKERESGVEQVAKAETDVDEKVGAADLVNETEDPIVKEGMADLSECFSLKEIHDYILANSQSIASFSRLYGLDILNDEGKSIIDQTSKEMKKKLHGIEYKGGIIIKTATDRFSFGNRPGDNLTAVGTHIVQSSASDIVQIDDEFKGKIVACNSKRHMTIKNFEGYKCEKGESYSQGHCEIREYSWNGYGLHLNEAKEKDRHGEINLVRKGLFVDKETGESLWYRAWHYIYWEKFEAEEIPPASREFKNPEDIPHWSRVGDLPVSRGDVLGYIWRKARRAAGIADPKYEEHSRKWIQFLRDTNTHLLSPEELKEKKRVIKSMRDTNTPPSTKSAPAGASSSTTSPPSASSKKQK